MYQDLYSSMPKLVGALKTWSGIANRERCECPAELGYRWVAWNSALRPELGNMMTMRRVRWGLYRMLLDG
jgi:aflatoxin B1 aldehyde reductase